jgi:hypothetical protein
MTMPTLVETIANGALFTFAPLFLLLAVDLVCCSSPAVRNFIAEGSLQLRWAPVKSGMGREQALKLTRQ